MHPDAVAQLIAARRRLSRFPVPGSPFPRKVEAEGGCGVVGLASSIPVLGRHILVPCGQMHNRGNGKGGGLAAAGLSAAQMGIDAEDLASDYLIQIALLDAAARDEVVRTFVDPALDVHAGYRIPTVDDYRDIPDLAVKPPDVWRYFARVRNSVLDRFIEEHGLTALTAQAAEDEFVSRWAFRVNQTFYGDAKMKAFVMSYGRDMLVLKIVGFAEQAFRYYRMEDATARIWIGHQRYPTKGRVWHPGGAHPFAALDVALVHNGDFANYHAVSEYLAQRHLYPLFLTDTEVAVLLFDLWSRTYGYPTEYVIEAMAPTTERDFRMLAESRQRIYRAIQAAHIHGSPDGPWFFIIARTLTDSATPRLRSGQPPRAGSAVAWQLMGITDTSMLRPQVFALQEGEVGIGIIASEKQAIDATLASLSHEDARICPTADRYWNARGGSYTDGGAFLFTVDADGRLTCTDKFGAPVRTPAGQVHRLPAIRISGGPTQPVQGGSNGSPAPALETREALTAQGATGLRDWSYAALTGWLDAVSAEARRSETARWDAVAVLTHLIDRRLSTGAKKRASVLALLHTAVYGMLRDVPPLNHSLHSGSGHAAGIERGTMHRVDWTGRNQLSEPPAETHMLVLDASGFPSEGDESVARVLVRAHEMGWRLFTVFALRGQRFVGCGFGARTDGVRMDIYGSSGDYLASGLDGIDIVVHNDAQDQVGQILKSGRVVIHGSVGQTLLYGAKGGDIFILGNAAGRPLINAVGRPRVVINGTALDYLAESFMAGDPLDGGGFCILNGVGFDVNGHVIDLDTPYPGGNLFSLASGGAIYARDPYRRLDAEQLNGGRFTDMTAADWEIILPILHENERHFGITIDRLLSVDGHRRDPLDVYTKVEPVELGVLK